MTRALLVPDEDVADLGVVEGVVGRKDRSAGNAEGYIDAHSLKRRHERLCSCHDLTAVLRHCLSLPYVGWLDG